MRSSGFWGCGWSAAAVLSCAMWIAACSNDPIDENTMMFGAVGGTGGAAGVPGLDMSQAGTAGGAVPVDQAGTGGAAGAAGAAGMAVPQSGSGGAAGTAGAGGAAGAAGEAGMAGMAGTGGMSGAGGMGGAGGEPEPPECVMGAVMPSQVIFIGDSYLDYGPVTFGPSAGNTPGGIQTQIEKRAVEDGVLMASEHYRPYYVSATRFLDGSIQRQYTMAKQQNPDIKVVVMDGGGNDVLLGQEGCSVLNRPTDPVCVDVVKRSTDACKELWTMMQADGVEEVVFFFYPNVPLAPGHSAASEPVAKANCDSFVSPLRCTFVSTLAAFDGMSRLIGGDGIHPTSAGQVVIGDLIWDAMVDKCIAQ